MSIPENGNGSVDQYTASILNCKPREKQCPLAPGQIEILEESVRGFVKIFSDLNADAKEIQRTYLETAVRTILWRELSNQESFLELEWLMRFGIGCVEYDMLDAATPYVLFQEACDWGSGSEKDQIANLFVDLKDKWKCPKFLGPSCKNVLLRFATELLSRLSKTSSAKARGRLLCYVSARIPMWDKGAANVLGDFNGGRCPTITGSTNGTATNVHENDKFAQLCNLLDCFKNPNLMTSNGGFVIFRTAFESVLDMMTPLDMKETEHEEGEHVEDGGRTRILTTGLNLGVKNDTLDLNVASVRYIPDPSSRVLENDLKQDRVKRNLLCRFLFVVQYFCVPARPKGASEPTEEQYAWCDQMVQTALAILSRTSPNGPLFVERLMDHLDSEASMSIWKDAGCPPLQSAPKMDMSPVSPFPPRNELPYAKVTRMQQGRERTVSRKSVRDLPLFGQGKMTGSMEVTRIVNKGPNTEEEFHNLGYQAPPIGFFQTVIEQAVTGETPKIINDEKYQWRALRILGKRTHIHFSNEADKVPTKDIGPFLENYILQLAEKSPELQAAKLALRANTLALPSDFGTVSDISDETGTTSTDPPMLKDDMDELMDSPEETMMADEEMEIGGHPVLNKDNILGIATQIGADWERFAGILKFDADSIAYWKSSHTDPVQQASQMLQVWTDQHSEPGSDSNGALEKLLGALKNEYGLDL